MNSLPVYIYFIAICFVISLTTFRKGNPTYLKFFPLYLLATMIIEYVALYLASVGKTNLWVYNFFTVIEFCFYLIILRQIIKAVWVRKAILWMIIIYPLIASINIVFFQGMNSLHTITYSLGCLLIVSVCIYYFFELFKYPKFISLANSPSFWICSGLLFFYCCSFPLFALINYWSNISPIIIENFAVIFTILNVFLYSLFMIAFLCRINRKYTLSS